MFTKLDITPAQAVLGDEVVIRTLEGEKTVTVVAGCQTNDTIKLKNEGIPVLGRNGQKGDHIVIINVAIPKKVSDEEKQLYRKLYELNTGKKANDSLFS